MLECIKLGGKTILYYDKIDQTIARMPTKSNLLEISSDNSLYCGTTDNEKCVKTLCKFFKLSSIENFSKKVYHMSGYGILCDIHCLISKQKQIQLKIGKDSVMHDLFNSFLLQEMKPYTNEDVLIVVDFLNNEIRFKKIREMKL